MKKTARLLEPPVSVPGGANTLYMDGHVEFIRYDEHGEPPANGMTARSTYTITSVGASL